jgi:hypothetical protein
MDASERHNSDSRKKGRVMTIEWISDDQPTARARWRNLITGECRNTPPPLGELDWVEGAMLWHCPD